MHTVPNKIFILTRDNDQSPLNRRFKALSLFLLHYYYYYYYYYIK